VSDPRIAEALWRPYVEDVALACLGRNPVEDTALVLAIGMRETWLGTCVGYEPKGRNGRGDGGHGRGLFQIDDRGPFKHLVPPDGEDWPVFVQAQAACQVLSTARRELQEFQSTLAPTLWETAVVCRYNSALSAVQWALRNGEDPNIVTTGKDYGRDVLTLRDTLRSTFPAVFPPPQSNVTPPEIA
jgi:hypothetical protein